MGRLLGCRETQSVGTFTVPQSKDVHSYLIDGLAALEGLATIAFGGGGGRKEKERENKQRSTSEHLGLFALVGWRDCLVAPFMHFWKNDFVVLCFQQVQARDCQWSSRF